MRWKLRRSGTGDAPAPLPLGSSPTRTNIMDAKLPFACLPGTVAVLGAGFSVPVGVPPTSMLSEKFLHFQRDWPTPEFIQRAVSKHLRKFWADVFGYDGSGAVPSFEDHFTLLDRTANSGHNLGHYYTPARLRALRRLSIHRVFEIIDVPYNRCGPIERFLQVLTAGEESAIVSLNWDIVVENRMGAIGVPFHYDVPGVDLIGTPQDRSAFPLIKLHGSANWHYCDSCHTALFGGPGHGKTAVIHRTFLEPVDFSALGEPPEFVAEVEAARMGGTPCIVCHNRKTTARVATFSYTKAFDFFLFHAAWDAALQRLRRGRRWIFIGYSLPEADFAFKHLLKTAQLASAGEAPKEVWVVTKDSTGTVEERFRQFFGRNVFQVSTEGLEQWVNNFVV